MNYRKYKMNFNHSFNYFLIVISFIIVLIVFSIISFRLGEWSEQARRIIDEVDFNETPIIEQPASRQGGPEAGASGADKAASRAETPDEMSDAAESVSPALALVEVSAYNTIPSQTDARPCESASGDYICGRTDVAACPPDIPFYAWVVIAGRQYECLDRTKDQAPNHYDLSFDKDLEGAINFGIQKLKVVKFK